MKYDLDSEKVPETKKLSNEYPNISNAKDNPLQGLTVEEFRAYRDCSSGMYYKAGIPFAIFCEFVSSFKKPGSSCFGLIVDAKPNPRTLMKRGFMFVGNVILGTLLFTPYCYYKMLLLHKTLEEKRKLEESNMPSVTYDASQPQPQIDDFSYPVDIMTNLNEPEGIYSTDFSPSGILLNDEKDAKFRPTTYQDLRARHRSRYGNNNASSAPAASTFNFDSGSSSSTLSSPVDKPESAEPDKPHPTPQRRVIRNKYGDEIE